MYGPVLKTKSFQDVPQKFSPAQGEMHIYISDFAFVRTKSFALVRVAGLQNNSQVEHKEV